MVRSSNAGGLIAADVVTQLGGSSVSYRPMRVGGGYVSSVEATIGLGCHPGYVETVRAAGGVVRHIFAAKESAAGSLIRVLRVCYGVRIKDVNWKRFDRARRGLARVSVSVENLAARNSMLCRSVDTLTLEGCELRCIVSNLTERNRELTGELSTLESENQGLKEKAELLQAGWRRTLEDFSSVQSSMVLGLSFRLAGDYDVRCVAAQLDRIEGWAKEMIDDGFGRLNASRWKVGTAWSWKEMALGSVNMFSLCEIVD